MGADSALVTFEVPRLDGTVIDDATLSVAASEGWVTIGDVLVDWTDVGTST